MGESKRDRYSYRSTFWPIVIVGIGLIALLRNLNVISSENLEVLLRLWPIFLVLIGLNLILGHRSPQLSALIGIGTVTLALVLVAVGPSMRLTSSAELKTEQYIEPLGNATSVRVDLSLRSGRTTVSALSDSNGLIDAEMTYRGDVEFDVRGNQEKAVRLRHLDNRRGFLFFDFDSTDVRSEIGLSPNVPMELDINLGSGTSTLDLSELQLTDLNVNNGSGRVDLELPETDGRYSARFNSGSGTVDVDVAEDATVNMRINLGSGRFGVNIEDGADVNANISVGSGRFTIDVPDDAGVQIEADVGSGSVSVPSQFDLVRSDRDRKGGTWETPDFDSAERRIIINANIGSGSLRVR